MRKSKMIKESYSRQLEAICEKSAIDFASVIRLLEAEKTKKLLKRSALIQQNIDKEIDNSLQNEN